MGAAVTRFTVAMVATLAAVVLQLALAAGAELPRFAFVGSAVVVSAWYGGIAPGLAATALGGVLVWGFGGGALAGLLVFFGEGVLASVLVGSLSRPASEDRTAPPAREDEPSPVPAASAAVHPPGEFLGVLSHELRNPLGALRNALRVMATGQRQEEALELSSRQVERLTTLVDGLLDVSRIERGSLQLEPELIELGAEIEAAAGAARPALAAHGKALHVSRPPEPVSLLADRRRLRQVILSLVDNATQHTAEGGNVWLEGRRDGREAVIVVRDDGAGIADEVVDEVFDAFRPHHGEPHRRRGGLGIGLAVVRALARLHGGDAAVRSGGPGRGTEATVRLPALPSAVDSAAEPR
jgi:signal transduction histidine kinase